MSLKFHAVSRKVINGKHAGEQRYYAQSRTNGKVGFDEICRRVSEQSSATQGDVEMVIEGFITQLCQELLSGNGVQLGVLGNFRITSSSTGVPLGEKFRGHHMGEPRITFFPGQPLRDGVEEISFEKISPIVVTQHVDCIHNW